MASPSEVLKRVPLFSGLSQRQLKRLARDFSEREIKSGTRVMREGETSGISFFVIVEGTATVSLDGAEVRQLGLTYRTAPESAGIVAAGDRAPDAPLRTADGQPVRLFELFRGPHATTLAFDGPAPAGPHSWTIVPAGSSAPGALVDVDGHAFRAYGATAGAVVQIRPDGYVGAFDRALVPQR